MEKIEKSRGVNQGAKFPSIGGQSSKDALNLEVGLENPPEDIITSDDQEEDPFEIEVRLMLDLATVRLQISANEEFEIPRADEQDVVIESAEHSTELLSVCYLNFLYQNRYLFQDCLEPSPDSEEEGE
ncbi:Protein CBG27211 [Caenorhabditis briggsae]|uniref:Protein CBG27211 n=1 Tax=Caenorhabditis briggsae TaxID=6238 RepID=B6IIA4_CAEBR|nr:Protein CBG27211 [Caenorhabditis briggsae]CAR99634.1 Protein CBG27211 [Caenorhabditis briggsae]